MFINNFIIYELMMEIVKERKYGEINIIGIMMNYVKIVNVQKVILLKKVFGYMLGFIHLKTKNGKLQDLFGV